MTVPMRKLAVVAALALAVGCKSTSSQSSGATATTSPTDTSASQGSQASTGTQRPQGGAAAQDPLMKPGSPIQGHAGDQVVSGQVGQVSAYSLVIQSDQGGTRILEIVPETAITLNEQDASYAELQEGQPVRASFANVDGHDVAVEIHVFGSGSPASSGLGTGSSASPDASTGTGSSTSPDLSTGTSPPDTSTSPGGPTSPEPGSVPAPGPGTEPSPSPGTVPSPDSSTMPR